MPRLCRRTIMGHPGSKGRSDAHADRGGPPRPLNFFRPRPRQRVARPLAGMLAVGVLVAATIIAFGHELISRLWGSYTRHTECFWHQGRPFCHRPLSPTTHLWYLAGIA